MEINPWHVDSIDAFYFLKCPECTFHTQKETKFQEHATKNHPLSFVLFGKEEIDDSLDILFGQEEIQDENFNSELGIANEDNSQEDFDINESPESSIGKVKLLVQNFTTR